MHLQHRTRSALLLATVVAAAAVAATTVGARGHPAKVTAPVGAADGATSRPVAVSGASTSARAAAATNAQAAAARARAHAAAAARVPRTLTVGAPTTTWQPVVTVAGRPAVWIAQSGGVTLLRFDQSVTELHLHAGSADPGGSGWLYGDQISPSEIHRVIAGFNGGFKFNVAGNGFVEGGRTAVPLSVGLGSIVTYADGTTAIGAWGQGVPAHGQPVVSVRQNLHLLVDQGTLAATATSCPLACWGATVGGQVVTARSGLGITAGGDLVWAAGERLTPAALGQALIGASTVRAVQLDINPFWVAGYLYAHHSTGPVAIPVVPGQNGIAGQLRLPAARDFFTVVAR